MSSCGLNVCLVCESGAATGVARNSAVPVRQPEGAALSFFQSVSIYHACSVEGFGASLAVVLLSLDYFGPIALALAVSRWLHSRASTFTSADS